MSGSRNRSAQSRVLTIWNHDYFKKGSGSDLQSLFVSLLGGITHQLPNRSSGVYLREKGHLLLLLSSDVGVRGDYRTTLPLTNSRPLLESDFTRSADAGPQHFFVHEGSRPWVAFSLRLDNTPKGLLLLADIGRLRVTPRQLAKARPALNNLATLLSTVDVVFREEQRSSRLALINRLCQQVDSAVGESNLYDRIVSLIQELFHYDHVGIYLIDKKSKTMVLQSLAGKYKGVIACGQSIPFGLGIISWVATHGKTVMSNDVRDNPYFLNLTPDLIPTEAELCVPIKVDDEIIGVLNVEHSELLSFDEDDINAVEVLAGRIAVAIKKSRLYGELHESHTRLEAIVSSMGQGLMIISPEFRVQWMNKTLEQWGHARLLGEQCYGLWSADSEFCRNCPSQKTFQDGLIHEDTVKSKADRYFAITSAPIGDGLGRVTQVLEVIDDITAEVAAQGELEHLKRELERSQRRASIGEVAASIVHEVRNPVNAMSEAVELLETDLQLTEEQAQLMDVVKEECLRLNATISSYLTLAHGKRLEFGPSNLKAIVEKVVTLLSADHAISRRIKLALDFPGDLPLIWLDSNAMRQVFWNLLLNSVESIEGRGNILVQAKYEPPLIYVIVSDDGKGIAGDNLSRIFEPFHTTKTRGTGLGLAIVKRIIEDHGWRITVESQQGYGTRFTMTIPQRQDERFP